MESLFSPPANLTRLRLPQFASAGCRTIGTNRITRIRTEEGNTYMKSKLNTRLLAVGVFGVVGAATCFAASAGVPATSIKPASMPKVGTVDERFQSYNVEMVEVTGGRFWKPYAAKADTAPPATNGIAGLNSNLFHYRQPIDLSNARLRKLAAALGPAYMRVSGTWANATFFQNTDEPAPATPPKGFNGVLTRQEWKGVVDFSKAVDARIVTSFATSVGTRDASGLWTPAQALQFVDYTKSIGGSIAAAEYMNEPNMPEGAATPKGYDAAAYGRDVAVFRAFAKQALPGMIFLGPGSSGEGTPIAPGAMRLLTSESLLTATGPAYDAFSYHSYGGVSSRCGMFSKAATTSPEAALSEEWLTRPGLIIDFYGNLRDRFEPGKPLWNTETAQTACGGDKWASTFLDSFRYLNQLGLSAKRGVQVHIHNTLASSDYGLLDETTFEPRPNYWAALLWRKFMGTTVLEAGVSPAPSMHLYAHCLRGKPGGVALLAINASKAEAQTLQIPAASERYTLTAQDLAGNDVELNNRVLKLRAGDELPVMRPMTTHSGMVNFVPQSITFLAIPGADNPNCR